jgi:hypothetical protein
VRKKPKNQNISHSHIIGRLSAGHFREVDLRAVKGASFTLQGNFPRLIEMTDLLFFET